MPPGRPIEASAMEGELGEAEEKARPLRCSNGPRPQFRRHQQYAQRVVMAA